MATSSDWQRLAALVSERRGDLALTQEDVRAAGGPSTATQRLIERGQEARYQLRILAGLEKALGWQRGSCRRILAGGDPLPILDGSAPTVPVTAAGSVTIPAPEITADPSGESPEDIAEITGVVVTILNARRGERGVWDEMRDSLARTPAGASLFSDPHEVGAWPPGEIPAELTPRARRALDDTPAGALFHDDVGITAASIGSYSWHLRVRMIAQLRETMRANPTQARRAG